ncbi:MAG: MoxR family ATPase [Pseudomonadota bacterium]
MASAAAPPTSQVIPETVEATEHMLQSGGYIADEGIATAVFLALKLQRPLLLEGDAGVGKTEIARVLSRMFARPLVRLQCYEGLDTSTALYEWNYPRQLLHIRLSEAENSGISQESLERDIFTQDYLLRRPLLQALEMSRDGQAPVLLIDELDRADEPFEAFLLELLADYQVTIPELGTIKAAEPPITILTSNRTREVHDAVRRRCFYHWIDHPNAERERAILALKVPQAAEALTAQIVAFVARLRDADLYKPPGVAETIAWAEALTVLDALELSDTAINSTLGTLLKYQDDIARVKGSEAARILAQIKAEVLAGSTQ